ncbi:unnamed protein product, partial [Arabidopsis halleri]
EGFECLSRNELADLSKPFSASEVENAKRSMGQFKSPGPDGFNPGFYQQCW